MRELLKRYHHDVVAVIVAVTIAVSLTQWLRFDEALFALGLLVVFVQLGQSLRAAEGDRRVAWLAAGLSIAALVFGYKNAPVIDCLDPNYITVANGGIDIPRTGCYAVDTEGELAEDEIERIDCDAGVKFDLIQAHAGRTVTVMKNDDLIMPMKFSLDAPGDVLQMECRQGTVAELNRSSGD